MKSEKVYLTGDVRHTEGNASDFPRKWMFIPFATLVGIIRISEWVMNGDTPKSKAKRLLFSLGAMYFWTFLMIVLYSLLN